MGWRDKVRDIKAKIAIDRRIYRAELGNLGDHKSCREGVWELRLDVGPGYRVYYAIAGKSVVLLLCGGRKHSQDGDILKACGYWKDWQLRGKSGGSMKDRTHDDAMAEVFRKERAYAIELLNSILEDGDQGELLVAIRQMTKAFGGVPEVAERAGLNRTQLYRTLSKDGNPEIRNLSAILKAIGLRLAVQQIHTAT